MPHVTAKAAKTNRTVGRTASKEVRRQQLIEATIESISKFGISGTTMTTVTGFAGLSMGIVNFHFTSKQTLFEETLRHLADEHRDQWRKAMKRAPKTPGDQLVAIADAQFHPSIYSRKKLSVWFAFYGEATARASYRKIMAQMDEERWDTMEGLCRQLIDDGNYPLVEPQHVANTLEGLFDGFCLNILLYPDAFSSQNAKTRIREYLAATFPQHIPHPAQKG